MKNIPFLFITLAAMMMAVSCDQPKKEEAKDNRADEMKARFKLLNEAFNTGNTAAIDTLLSANAEDHTEDPNMKMPKGPEGLKQMIGMMRTAVPDLKSDIKYMAVDGDILMAYGTTSGTNSGPMMGMPATNKSYEANFCDVVKFDNDLKITDHWGVYDEAKMMRDLGMMPPMSGAPMDTTKKM